MSKRAAVFYGLLFGAITASVLLNGLWLALIIAAVAVTPSIFCRIRDRRTPAKEMTA